MREDEVGPGAPAAPRAIIFTVRLRIGTVHMLHIYALLRIEASD